MKREKQFGMEIPVEYETIECGVDELFDADEQIIENMKLRLRDAGQDE